MCIICSTLQDFDPGRHINIEPGFATVTEGQDAAEDISTTYVMSVGDEFEGSIDVAREQDWVAITLEEGTTYTIDQFGRVSGGGTLSDTYLRLYDSNGNLLALDDDSGAGWEARISITSSTTGTYYVSAGAFGSSTGSYTLSVTETRPAANGTLDELANFTANYWSDYYVWETTSDNIITVNLTNLTAEGQQLARWAMEAWEMVADIDFVEQSSGANINIDDNQSGAFAYAPNTGGGVMNVSVDWLNAYGTRLDTYPFQTYIHEFGHAIGLYHQGTYNGSATYGVDNVFANDSWQLSVMSYFSQTENTSISASYAFVATAQMADIIAIQSLYGAPDENSATAGNTTYGVGSNVGNYLDNILDWFTSGMTSSSVGGNRMTWTIYDHSGVDTLNFSTMSDEIRLDMREEQFSDFGRHIGIMGIARDTVIEHAITGSGDDTVTGNDAANRIYGEGGDDMLSGGTGNDIIWGGAGADQLFGGDGRDRASYTDATAGVIANLEDSSVNAGFAQGDTFIEIEDLQGSHHGDELVGNAGANRLWGWHGDDMLSGGAGNDILWGGAGADEFHFIGDFGKDHIKDFSIEPDQKDIIVIDISFINNYSDIEKLFIQDGEDLVIRFNAENYINIENIHYESIDENEFVFI